MRDLSGKVVFVTGGVSGIGFALVKAFTAVGARVVATYRSEEHRDEARAFFDTRPDCAVRFVRLDVTDREAMRAAAEETYGQFGRVDILCNNAGVNLLGEMDRATYDDWDWVLGVNLGGVINAIVTFIPRMKAQGEGGHVINVASMSSFIGSGGSGVYTTSKFAVRGLSECLRYNLAPFGIGVSLVCPGLTRSRIFEAPLRRPPQFGRTAFPVDAGKLERLAAVHAVGMDPDEVARKTIEGVARNDFYIFPHPEFREELIEDCGEITAAFAQEDADPKRLAIEAGRREAKEAARRAVRLLRESL